jgi:hypothetical protein
MRDLKVFGLALLLVWSTMLIHIPTVYSEVPVQENVESQAKVAAFLSEVGGFNISKYEVLLNNYRNFDTGFADAIGSYDLVADSGNLSVSCNFRTNNIVGLEVFPRFGSTLFSQDKGNTVSAFDRILVNYQNFSKAPYIAPLRELLSQLTELTNVTKTSGNLKMTVYPRDYGYVLIDWMNTVNGIKNIHSRFGVQLCNGTFSMFADGWNRYPVGSGEVNVSKEQAISIVMDRLRDFSYEVGGSNVTGLGAAWNVTLYPRLTMEIRDGVLFPCWEMYVPLAGVYPGNVVAVHFYMWADTGEISSMTASSRLGVFSPEEGIVPDGSSVDSSPLPFQTPAASPDSSAWSSPSSSQLLTPAPSLQPTAVPSQPLQSIAPSPTADSSGLPLGGIFPVLAGLAIVAAVVVGFLVFVARRKAKK